MHLTLQPMSTAVLSDVSLLIKWFDSASAGESRVIRNAKCAYWA